MKIISWNVNGIRAVLNRNLLAPLLATYDPDVLCLQETKAQPAQVHLDLPSHPFHFWNGAERKGYADAIRKEGHKPLSEFLRGFVDARGKLWVCSACANARQITKDDLIEGAAIAGAMSLVDHVGNGAAVVM